MKRRFSCLITWITQPEIKENLILGTCFIIAFFIGIVVYFQRAPTPTTEKKFEILEKQAIEIQNSKDIDLLFKIDCNIFADNDTIEVTFKNDDCSLTVQYNKNFEIQSISKSNTNLLALQNALLAAMVSLGVLVYLAVKILLENEY